MIQENNNQPQNHVIGFLRYEGTILEIRIPLVNDKVPEHINYLIQGIRRRCVLVGYADGAPYYRIQEIL
jgi:hypothetical protein